MTRRRVLILGGGHAGVRCARELIRARRSADELDITLVSRENVEVWHGLMPQIVSGVLQAQHVLIPLREILTGVTIYSREIESIGLAKRQAVLSQDGEGGQVELEADYLVIALGSVTDLSRFPGLTEHALQTKTIGDFIHLRNHLIAMLEAASVTSDAAERQRLLTFVVAGAGYAGVEIASEANEFLRASLRSYPMLDPKELRVITVDILTRILPTFNDRLTERVVERMQQRGIELRLGVGLKDATGSWLPPSGYNLTLTSFSGADVDRWQRPFRVAGTAAAFKQMIPHGIQGWTLDDLVRVRVPAVVVWGAHDATDGVKEGRTSAKALRAPFVLLARAGHLSMLADPRGVARAVGDAAGF